MDADRQGAQSRAAVAASQRQKNSAGFFDPPKKYHGKKSGVVIR